jgi:hypothetical protein
MHWHVELSKYTVFIPKIFSFFPRLNESTRHIIIFFTQSGGPEGKPNYGKIVNSARIQD